MYVEYVFKIRQVSKLLHGLIQSLLITGLLTASGGLALSQPESHNSIANASVPGCSPAAYSNAKTSKYILPFEPGAAFLVNNGNCGRYATHRPHCKSISSTGEQIDCGDLRYACDFSMPVGVTIIAARAGAVIAARDGLSNASNDGAGNVVFIMHADETVAEYFHLSPGSIVVTQGQGVELGAPVAKSGSSGLTAVAAVNRNPHLRFHVPGPPYVNCDATTYDGGKTLAISFVNASPGDSPLIENKVYRALAYKK